MTQLSSLSAVPHGKFGTSQKLLANTHPNRLIQQQNAKNNKFVKNERNQ